MRFDTHLASGFTSAAAAVTALPPPLNYFVAVGCVVGSVLPDSDIANPGKTLSHRLGKKRGILGGLISAATLAVRALAILLGYGLFFIATVFRIKHRKEFHSPLFPIVLGTTGLLTSLFFPEFGILLGLGIGWLIHLLLDSLTPSGIQWGKYKVSGPITTGGMADSAVRVIMHLASLLILFVGSLPPSP